MRVTYISQRRGSVLLVAMIFAIGIALAISGYLYLAARGMHLANRSFHLNTTVGAAEAGLEEAMLALNTYKPYAWSNPNASAWNRWQTGVTVHPDLPRPGARIPNGSGERWLLTNSQNSVAEFQVLIEGYTTDTPIIIAKATFATPHDGTMEKVLRASASRRPLNALGMVARDRITLNGSVVVDSYNSSIGPYEEDLQTGGAARGQYDPAEDQNNDGIINRFSNATVASAFVGLTPIAVGNADIFGTVATGGEQPQVGPGGIINEIGSTGQSPTRIATDFQENFVSIDVPPGTPYRSWSNLPTVANLTQEQPDPDDPINPDTPVPTDPLRIERVTVAGRTTWFFGVEATPSQPNPATTVIRLTNLTLSGQDKIVIRGPVRIIVDGNVSISGSGGVEINNMPYLFSSGELINSTKPPLQMFVGGDLNATGTSFVNAVQPPAALQIFSTKPETSPLNPPQWYFRGTTDFNGVVYAPNCDIEFDGTADTFGSVVGNRISLTGTGAFHFDEALRNLRLGRFGLDLWQELIRPAQRLNYAWAH